MRLTKSFYGSILTFTFLILAIAIFAYLNQKDSGLKHISFRMPTLDIKGSEGAMSGPGKFSFFEFESDKKQEKLIWVRSFEGRLIDETTDNRNDDYFCHAHLFSGKKFDPKKGKFLGVHAGANRITLPKGYAIPFSVSKEKPLGFFGMAADYAGHGISKKVHYEMNVEFYDDSDAKKLGIQPLDFIFVRLKQVKNKNVKRATKSHNNHDKFHWLIPPGRHVYREKISDRVPELFGKKRSLHHIHLHLHPYAEFGELFDKTTNKTVWRGYVKTFEDRSVVKDIDHYSDTKGLEIFPDHEYELVAVYNNPKATAIDGMLTVRFFYR